MNGFSVQIQRPDGWRHLTTVPFERLADDADGGRSRAAAYTRAVREMQNWQTYDSFDGFALRVAEQTIDGYKEARP